MERSSTSLRVEGQDFAQLALGADFKGATADFTVRRESLGSHARVKDELEALAAEGALNGSGDLHGRFSEGSGAARLLSLTTDGQG